MARRVVLLTLEPAVQPVVSPWLRGRVPVVSQQALRVQPVRWLLARMIRERRFRVQTLCLLPLVTRLGPARSGYSLRRISD